MLSRIEVQHDEGATLTDSVTTGLARSGWIVSMAAVILSVSFIQLFGIGSDLAVLIDATLIRGILVPAAFRLMGRWARWSPAPLRSLHTRIGLTESTPG